MKITKLILALSASVFCINAMGANMCIKDDVVMVILDPVVAGSSLSSNATGKTWSTSFNYGVISGIGGCGAAPSPVSAGTPAPDQSVLSPTSTGTYCYCKMLHPMPSQWVYSGYNSNASTLTTALRIAPRAVRRTLARMLRCGVGCFPVSVFDFRKT